MASDIQICNMAIGALGSGKLIANFTEKSDEARACNLHYDTARDKVLAEFPWPFASKYGALGLVATTPNDDWLYSYGYPSDCITAIKVVGAGRNPARNQEIPFEVGNSGTSRIILTNQADAVLKYTARITNTGLFPPDFVKVLSLYLAAQIGPSITGGDPFKAVPRVTQLYAFEKSQAMATRSNESTKDIEPQAESITARG